MKFKILNVNGDTTDLMIYDQIASYTEAGGQSISKQLAELEGKTKKLRVFINSPGGSVTEGIAIFNLLSRTSMEVVMYVDGVAASMAGILTQVPHAKRYMSKYAKMMLHSVSGFAVGSSEDMRNTADMMDDFQNSLVSMISDRTKRSPEEIKGKYFDGKDHWLNAEQALEAKFIDGVVDGKLNVQPPKAEDANTLHTFYKQQILNFNSQHIMNKKVMNLLGLTGEVNDQQIEAAVAQVEKRISNFKAEITGKDETIKKLQARVDAFSQEKVDELINNAVQAGKITAEMKPTYETLAKSNFDDCKKILDSIPPYKSIQSQLGNDDSGIPEDRKRWSFSDWQKNDGPGLAKIKAEKPDLYKEIYKKQFGHEPENV